MNKGQSLFELVIAIGISALIIVVLVSLVSSALQNAAFSKNETLAGKYAQESTEWLRGQRDSDINSFIENISSYPSGAATCFKTLAWSVVGPCGTGDKIEGLFVRQISFKQYLKPNVNNEPKNIIEANITVSWTDSKGIHEVTNVTDFSDWRQR